MKTIIFSTDEKLIEEYRQQGEIVVAKNPVKTLQAMKKLGARDDYKVVGDDKYVEVAKKLGYNKIEVPKETPIQTVGKLTSYYDQQLKDQEQDFNNKIAKLQGETNEFKKLYNEKIKELEQKKTELEVERTKIKKAIKNAIN